MFYVINKEKIIAYVVTVFTIVVLYCVASTYEDNQVVSTSNMVINGARNDIILQEK